MNCISINYKNADEGIRSSFAFAEEIQKRISKKLSECVILCTCNRTEIYFCGDINAGIAVLSEFSGIAVDEIKKYAMVFMGRRAALHLFRVACGIESMVIGEDEILGQTRNAYKNACEFCRTNSELNIYFQSALACAKKIKTETELSGVSVSTATLTANVAAKFCENPKILVIGATGRIGQTIVKNLISHRNVSVTVTLRHHSKELFSSSNSEVSVIGYKERYSFIDEFDCVISATSSPHYTVTYSELRKHIHTDKKRLFIDLSVPHDIDKRIEECENIQIIGIDYFENLAHENNIRKTDSIEIAKKYIEKEADTAEKNLLVQSFLAEYNPNADEKKLICKLKSELSAEQLSAVLKVMKESD